MKKFIAIALLIVPLAACENMDYGSCLKSHTYTTIDPIHIGKMTTYTTHVHRVCDEYQYPDGHGPKYSND